MDLNVDISKLPADVRKTYKRYQVMHAEKRYRTELKRTFFLLLSASGLISLKGPITGTLQKNLIN